ncbi:hypothetical protein [Pseudoalteromonas sp. BSi20429]|uniref:hypothetical protein n=1 Tax=Pseudoalteromonas sp. BSi20429 TaxID=1097676 RepID=UPI0002317C7E|nr:hypothetical protein [Pseudoalteromonas sp. BSi20429]GAA66469.1 hypothetical protein P20429_0576 [Pseudoalteromonas sp. BSi20429]
MTFKQLFNSALLLLATAPPLVLLAWDEQADPAFIPNGIYNTLTFTLFPIMTIVLSVALFKHLYRKYNNNFEFKHTVKDYIVEHGKFRSVFIPIGLPILIYLWLWTSVCISVKLLANKYGDNIWHQEYQLLEVGTCPTDYEYSCAKLTVLDLKSYKKHTFRWYLDKGRLVGLQNNNVNLVGVKSPLGKIVQEIQW